MREMIKAILIDEAGEYRLRSKKESDHNTIVIDIENTNLVGNRPKPTTKWNINAPLEACLLFREELTRNKSRAEQIMSEKSISMDSRYGRWNKLTYKAAMKSIGKSTTKVKLTPKPSPQLLQLRKEKRQLKKEFEGEDDYQIKGERLEAYISKQKEIQALVGLEEKEKIKKRFAKMS